MFYPCALSFVHTGALGSVVGFAAGSAAGVVSESAGAVVVGAAGSVDFVAVEEEAAEGWTISIEMLPYSSSEEVNGLSSAMAFHSVSASEVRVTRAPAYSNGVVTN